MATGDLVYFVVPTPDAGRAQRFYGDLLGWEFSPGSVEGGFNIEGHKPPGGLFGGGEGTSPTVYFEVDDIEAAVGEVRSHGRSTIGAVEKVAAANEEAVEAWDGVLFDRFLQFRDIVTTGLGAHGEEAMRIHPPNPGDKVLDVGCGFGDTTRRLAELVGPDGEAVGIDVSERFVEESRRDAEEVGAINVSFIAGDVQIADLGEGYDYVFSRMGVMFFANPVAALRNIRSAMVPGGRFTAAVWRRKLDNEWVHRAERVVERYLEEPEDSDEPTCGPGPFSMANADTVSEQLQIAGFGDISFHRCDIPIRIGDDLDHAVAFNLALGPAAEVIRLVGDEADEIRPVIEKELREVLTEFDGPGGVLAPASTWIVGARAPA